MADKKNNPEVIFQEGTVLRDNGKEDNAIEKYLKAYDLFEEEKNTKRAAETLQMIGVCYRIKNDTKNSIANLKIAAAIFEDIEDLVGLGNTYRDMALSYMEKGDLGEALIWISKSDLVLKKTDNLSALGITQVKYGTVYVRLGQLQQGRIFITKGLVNIRKTGSWFNEMTALLHMSEHSFIKENYAEMLAFLWAALGIIFEYDEEKRQKKRVAEIYGLLAWAYFKSDNPEYGNMYLAKSQKLLAGIPESVRELIVTEVKQKELEKALNTVSVEEKTTRQVNQ
jgi:tetratricopeptide (TPR) repeat protein